MKTQIVSVIAKGDLNRKINLENIVKEIAAATLNEGYKGRMVEIPFKKVKASDKLIFEACTGNDNERQAKILLFRSGKYSIRCKDPALVEYIEAAFVQEINKLL